MSVDGCSCGGECGCKGEENIRRAKPGELVRCRWCEELPLIIWDKDYNNLKICCDGGNGAKECSAYPSTSNGGFGPSTGHIVSRQWSVLNSELSPQDARDSEKLHEEVSRKLEEK